MAKQWECGQCGNYEMRTLVGSLRGAPEECDNCGNTEFESPTVVGSVHSTIDRFGP